MNESISIVWQSMGMQAEDRRTGLVTPEAVSLNLEIAGVGSRLIGVIVDGLIQGAVLFAGVMAGSASPDFGDGFALVVIGIIFFTLVIYGYQGIFEGLWEGQTPGKKVARTRVVSDNGQPVGWRQVVIRSIFRLIDNSPIGVLTIIL
ncbi:MAG TPA: RDD family protein, partial [Actinomycetota bacterium]|nr:RDD family protein [Actinomycetota bacterium]